jgi:regulator of protease activity HflC (stomatin/prohibitin superfamily)
LLFWGLEELFLEALFAPPIFCTVLKYVKRFVIYKSREVTMFKNKWIKVTMFLLALIVAVSSCSYVPPGEVGIKVYLTGSNKGVDFETLKPGRYWIGYNERLYCFPTFTQNYVYSKSAHEGRQSVDESFSFQTGDGMNINGDFGISWHIEPVNVSKVFQKYQKGPEEITTIYIRNMIRNALNSAAAPLSIEAAYGAKKNILIKDAERQVINEAAESGITVEKLFLISDFRLPQEVKDAINSKIAAIQRAQQKENEVAMAKAEAEKAVATAEGEARAIYTVAKAQADANKLLTQSITTELIKYKSIEKWNGELPKIAGSGIVPMVQFDNK